MPFILLSPMVVLGGKNLVACGPVQVMMGWHKAERTKASKDAIAIQSRALCKRREVRMIWAFRLGAGLFCIRLVLKSLGFSNLHAKIFGYQFCMDF